MKLYELSFCTVGLLQDDIAEVIVNEGADINLAMVDEIHQCFLAIFPDTFSLLINKKNSYSTQLDALIQFGTLESIDKIAIFAPNKIAIFAPNKMAKMSADFSANIPSSAILTIQVFTNRDDALIWLI